MKKTYTARHPKSAFLEGFLSVFGLYPQAHARFRDVAKSHMRERQGRRVGYWQSVGGYLQSAMDRYNSEVPADVKKRSQLTR
jgi:hypothetical protein